MRRRGANSRTSRCIQMSSRAASAATTRVSVEFSNASARSRTASIKLAARPAVRAWAWAWAWASNFSEAGPRRGGRLFWSRAGLSTRSRPARSRAPVAAPTSGQVGTTAARPARVKRRAGATRQAASWPALAAPAKRWSQRARGRESLGSGFCGFRARRRARKPSGAPARHERGRLEGPAGSGSAGRRSSGWRAICVLYVDFSHSNPARRPLNWRRRDSFRNDH